MRVRGLQAHLGAQPAGPVQGLHPQCSGLTVECFTLGLEPPGPVPQWRVGN